MQVNLKCLFEHCVCLFIDVLIDFKQFFKEYFCSIFIFFFFYICICKKLNVE